MLLWKRQQHRLKDIKLQKTYSSFFIFECGPDLLRGLLGLCRQDANLVAPQRRTCSFSFFRLVCSVCLCFLLSETISYKLNQFGCRRRVREQKRVRRGKVETDSKIVRQLLASFGMCTDNTERRALLSGVRSLHGPSEEPHLRELTGMQACLLKMKTSTAIRYLYQFHHLPCIQSFRPKEVKVSKGSQKQQFGPQSSKEPPEFVFSPH